jgi:UDP-N-acetyl-D-glucosamine dehydrogenase
VPSVPHVSCETGPRGRRDRTLDVLLRQLPSYQGKPLKRARILLLGLAYKANVDDDRESPSAPSYVLIEKLEARGAVVDYNDPNVPVIRLTREHAHMAGRLSVPITSDYDLILISTAHEEYQRWDFSDCPIPVVDTWNCVKARPKLYYRA